MSAQIADEATREEVAEALGWACQAAKRAQYVVEKFTTDNPTPWTLRHRQINDLLDRLELAP